MLFYNEQDTAINIATQRACKLEQMKAITIAADESGRNRYVADGSDHNRYDADVSDHNRYMAKTITIAVRQVSRSQTQSSVRLW